jgi:nucleoredoxin
MRYLGLLALLLVAAAATAGPLPLTVSEISLMLRTGYSSSAIETELAARHFADTLDEAKRKSLIQAGATGQLVDALTSGKYAAPREEIDKAQRTREEQNQRRVLAAEQEKRFNTLHQDQLAKERKFVASQPSADIIAQVLKGNLVRCQNGLLTSYYDEELNRKKIYGLYFSAHWCPPCRKFTPQLVDYYKRIEREHPEFEIVFISADKTADAMAGYMRDTGMPWPAIDYAKVSGMTALNKYLGSGIPDLVIIDGSGKILADSYVKGNYVGPAQVLADLDNLFAKNSAQALVTH